MISFFVWARPQIAVAIVDPYNTTVLCIYSLPECNVDIEHPLYTNLNRLLAQIIFLVIDGISSFDGTQNVDFTEVQVQSSLVPYPRIHFTLWRFTPVISAKGDSLVHQRIKPVRLRLLWTSTWRDRNRKGKADETEKSRARKVCASFDSVVIETELRQYAEYRIRVTVCDRNHRVCLFKPDLMMVKHDPSPHVSTWRFVSGTARLVFRAASGNPDVNVVAMNDSCIHLNCTVYQLMCDTVHGKFNGTYRCDSGGGG